MVHLRVEKRQQERLKQAAARKLQKLASQTNFHKRHASECCDDSPTQIKLPRTAAFGRTSRMYNELHSEGSQSPSRNRNTLLMAPGSYDYNLDARAGSSVSRPKERDKEKSIYSEKIPRPMASTCTGFRSAMRSQRSKNSREPYLITPS